MTLYLDLSLIAQAREAHTIVSESSPKLRVPHKRRYGYIPIFQNFRDSQAYQQRTGLIWLKNFYIVKSRPAPDFLM